LSRAQTSRIKTFPVRGILSREVWIITFVVCMERAGFGCNLQLFALERVRRRHQPTFFF
jgi:hypothetical protein